MITIDKSLCIGKGSERYCYRHPDDQDICIKVAYKAARNDKQNIKEYQYYRKRLKRVSSWAHIPRCHGWVATDLGPGLAFDFISDIHGKPCRSLHEILVSHSLSLDQLAGPLEELRSYLLDNRIIVCDLRSKNILCRTEGHQTRLYLVDGLGNGDFLKIADHVPALARAKIERHWQRFSTEIKKI